MEWIEVTGRTLDEAKDIALDQLGVHESELEVEVLAEAKSGFLGMGRADARIRARVRPLSRDKPDHRRRRRGRDRSDRGGGRSPRGPEGDGPRREASEGKPEGTTSEPRRSGGRSRRRRGGSNRPAAAAGPKADVGPEADATGARAGGPAGKGPGSARAGDGGVGDRRPGDRAEGDTVDVDVSLEDQRDAIVDFAVGLVDAFGFDAEVEGRIEDDTIWVEVHGDDLGLLIGPRAATLDAVEELARAVLQRITDGNGARLRLDVGGYRERRRTALEEFTRRVADEVRASGEPRALEPMHANDRKVVHDVIAEMDDLETASEGEDHRRRVVVRPA